MSDGLEGAATSIMVIGAIGVAVSFSASVAHSEIEDKERYAGLITNFMLLMFFGAALFR